MKSRNSLRRRSFLCVAVRKLRTGLLYHAVCSHGFAPSGRVRSTVSSSPVPVRGPESTASRRRKEQSRFWAAPYKDRPHRRPLPQNPDRCSHTSFCAQRGQSSACEATAKRTAHRRRPTPARSMARSTVQTPWAVTGREPCECAGRSGKTKAATLALAVRANRDRLFRGFSFAGWRRHPPAAAYAE
jgi:hypothetical protein